MTDDSATRATAAVRTLERLGYTHHGGQEWCPPLGKRSDFDLLDARGAQIERLRRDCAEAYQATGFLADCLGYWTMAADDPRQAQISKLLDNLSDAAQGDKRRHDDLLPFGWQA